MNYEVEQKFPVPDVAEIERCLGALGVEFSPAVQQVDAYFAHPSRDFARTDEAFRIRRIGERNLATYKGPKVDAETKTRREIELPLASGEGLFPQYQEMLEALGFRLVAEVPKSRRQGKIAWEGGPVNIDLDDVRGVGDFLELELIADESSLDAAKARLKSLAEHLGLTSSERRSYLQMLLEGR